MTMIKNDDGQKYLAMIFDLVLERTEERTHICCKTIKIINHKKRFSNWHLSSDKMVEHPKIPTKLMLTAEYIFYLSIRQPQFIIILAFLFISVLSIHIYLQNIIWVFGYRNCRIKLKIRHEHLRQKFLDFISWGMSTYLYGNIFYLFQILMSIFYHVLEMQTQNLDDLGPLNRQGSWDHCKPASHGL